MKLDDDDDDMMMRMMISDLCISISNVDKVTKVNLQQLAVERE